MSNRSISNTRRVQNANLGDNYGIINQGAGFVDGSAHWHRARIAQQTNNIAGSQYQFFNVRSAEDLIRQLNPILDASHTRNRKRSPPDSECFPGTREEPIREIIFWADGGETVHVYMQAGDSGLPENYTMIKTPHIYWLHGFAGCGKSSISLEIAKIYAGSGRLLASYFFFRGAGDRSTMNRFTVTLASHLMTAIPATAPLIRTAVKEEPGLVAGDVPLATQLDLLVLSPFQTVLNKGVLEETRAKGPFIIVVDGLDECEDKQGVEEFIDHMLAFFQKHPSIPLRIFIASRVEQHIRECLETDGVWLGNLDSHPPREDLEKYLRTSFQAAAKRDRVIRAYVRARGEWPSKSDMDDLIEHIGGSFVLASTIFKSIVQPATTENPLTPMERLPLALKMNGLDGLYAQTLARSQHLPHFHNIISTVALLVQSISIIGIADLLGIQAFEVVRVLLNLQAIIHVPGTDDEGKVTLCHTSLRDFLTTERRSGSFFVPPSFHLYLSYYCFAYISERRDGELSHYGWMHFIEHWRSLRLSEACNFIDEIEQFKARPSLFVDRVPSHAFLCTMFWWSIVSDEPLVSDRAWCIFIECAQHLALAVECPDSRIRRWLEFGMPANFTWPALMNRHGRVFQYTEQTYEAVQRASTAIRAKFPELLKGHHCPIGTEQEHHVGSSLSGIEIFKALEWIVARAHLKWEEAKIPLRLHLYIFCDWSRNRKILSFDF